MNELWIQAIGFVGVNLHSFSFLFPFSMIKNNYISARLSLFIIQVEKWRFHLYDCSFGVR